MNSPYLHRVSFPESGGHGYSVAFSTLERLPALMSEAGLRIGRCLIVTDEHVGPNYADRLVESLRSSGRRPEVMAIPSGESSKSLDVLSGIYDWALGLRIDRSTPLLALGGGVVGDLAGFAAATLLRGIPLVQIPTTLIAQVDSAIGGKTGINHGAGKNLVGAFFQPSLVCVDVTTLLTLPQREWVSGLAETAKHALIADPELFAYLRAHWPAILGRNLDAAAPAIRRSAGVKVGIVSRDEREAGIRAFLNFGHTFGHAIEKVTGYGTFTHGEAVALGMAAALHLSGELNPAIDLTDALELVRAIPVEGDLSGLDVDPLMEAMQVDKKRAGGRLRFVVLDELGKARVTDAVDEEQVRRAWTSILRPGDGSGTNGEEDRF